MIPWHSSAAADIARPHMSRTYSAGDAWSGAAGAYDLNRKKMRGRVIKRVGRGLYALADVEAPFASQTKRHGFDAVARPTSNVQR